MASAAVTGPVRALQPAGASHPVMDTVSTYKEQFHAYPGVAAPPSAALLRREQLKRDVRLTHETPEHYETTTKSNFLPDLVSRATAAQSFRPRPRRVYTSKFAATTTAQHEFDATAAIKGARGYARRVPERHASPL